MVWLRWLAERMATGVVQAAGAMVVAAAVVLLQWWWCCRVDGRQAARACDTTACLCMGWR